MHARLRKLWISWTVLALCVLLASSLGLGWLAQRAAARLAAPELRQTAEVIGRSLVREIERALNYQVPIDRLVDVDGWFREAVDGNAMLEALVLADAGGRQLAAVGATPALQAAVARLQQDGGAGAMVDQALYLAAIEVRGRDGAVAGRLYVASVAPPLGWQGWLWSLAAALLLAAAVCWLLRGLVRRRLQRPLQACVAAAEQLAAGDLPLLPLVGVRDPATQYQASLAERIHGLRRRNDYLLLKAGEVRAAHFDPGIVQALDQLAVPLARRQHSGSRTLPEQAWARRRLPSGAQRALLAACSAIALIGACAWGLHHEYRLADERRLLGAGNQVLQQAWQATLDEDRVQLDAELNRLMAHPGMAALLAGDNDQALDDVLEEASTPSLMFAIFHLDGTPRVASGQKDETTRIDPLTLAPLRQAGARGGAAIHGVWQNAAHVYQSGVARRVDLDERDTDKQLVVMAARPLEDSLARLRRRLQQTQAAAGEAPPTALADLRGQPLADAYAPLVAQWTRHGRQSTLVGEGNEPAALLAVLGLNAPSGHALGTLIARLPLPAQMGAADGALVLACLALAAAALATLLFYLRGLFTPLAQATRRLERLADGDTDEEEPEQQNRESRMLYRVVRRIGEKIDALETLRRSRERQGKRQARFIRLQMMQLAERLDDVARRGILEDLERIEHASRPQAPSPDAAAAADDPRLERIVDEFGILALGFQNLVSRVGQQYQELDRLVAELREALRTKTQFIALQQELEIARKMQLSILPREFNSHPLLELHATMLPAKEVGGDFYDFFDLDQHRVALVVADVSGKGVPAAFFMAISRTLLRAVAPFSESASSCIARVNDLLAADNEEMMFVTLFYAILDTRDGSLSYTNAGHNPPYLLRAAGGVEALPSTRGIALAVAEDMAFREGAVTLQPGDSLFLFTDGITEAADPDGQLYGEQRLAGCLDGLRALAPAEANARVMAAIKHFEAGGPQADDITCLMARYRSRT
ncbi:SpoIIE family protein phosphatase [Herbaspirillum robiniae]|uniref:SpoIIE family protein phosphatase n=1 Tax=Herbaspirillum robiniae TaxID=2014887 RepID=UPI003D76D612